MFIITFVKIISENEVGYVTQSDKKKWIDLDHKYTMVCKQELIWRSRY